MADLTPTAAPTQAPPVPGQEPCAPAKKDKAAAYTAFNILNYFGIGWLLNSTASLWITYNVLPTKPAQAAISKLEQGLRPVVAGFYKLKGGSRNGNMMRFVPEKARSAAEICCMCISGCLMLIPMKMMEDRRESIVSWIDRRLNPSRYANQPAAVEAPEPEEPQPWAPLLAARGIGIGGNLAIDQAIEGWNNDRTARGLENLDSMEWRLGNKVYDRMQPATRDGLSNFFARHGQTVEGIQPMVRERLSKVVGTDAKRMVFAEQSRLFQKEFGLTLVLAGVVFASTKGLGMLGFGRHAKKEKPCAEPVPVAAPPVEEHAAETSGWREKAPPPAGGRPGWGLASRERNKPRPHPGPPPAEEGDYRSRHRRETREESAAPALGA